MQVVSVCLLGRCFRNALDEVQFRQHEHFFRFGFYAEKGTFLELAKNVGERLLFAAVANDVQDGLRLPLWRQVFDETRACVNPLQATFLHVFDEYRPAAITDLHCLMRRIAAIMLRRANESELLFANLTGGTVEVEREIDGWGQGSARAIVDAGV